MEFTEEEKELIINCIQYEINDIREWILEKREDHPFMKRRREGLEKHASLLLKLKKEWKREV